MIRERINDRLPDSVKLGYGTIYIYTEQGLNYMDRLADWKHIDRATDAGVATFLASMVAAFGVLVWISISMLQSTPEPTEAQDPVNLLAIPGVNEFLPLAATAYIVFALFVAAGVHEAAHGVAMRAEEVTVDELGIILLLGFPIAAYVMPDDDEFEAASVRSRARILSAGVFANLFVFGITSLLFALPGTGSPIDAFLVYFGAVFGGSASASGTVGSLGIVTNLLFWVWFFNVNLAFVNVLPVFTLDGGRIAGLLPELSDVSIPVKPDATSLAIVSATSVGTLAVFSLAVFGPLIL